MEQKLSFEKLKSKIGKLALYVLLFGGVIIVLLPLLWMILTAFKQRGQALQFQFLPSKTVRSPKKILSPIDKNQVMVTFEYDPKKHPSMPSPREVAVAGDFNGWKKSRDILVKEGSVWVTSLSNLKTGAYQYKFVINGNKWTADLCNSKKSKSGNSIIQVQRGYNSNKSLSDSTKLQGNKIFFKILNRESKSLSILLGKNKTTIHLIKKGNYFLGEAYIPPHQPVEYQLLQPQTFREGLDKIYTFQNFGKVLRNKDFPFALFFLNSLIVATGTALLTVFICTMAGYAFAKKDFFLRDYLFVALMSTMMIPGMIFMVPQFAIVNKLGWINTYQGMMVPHLANIFGLFLLKQYITTIPNSLFEAATIDGASEWQIFRIIIIPLSFPIMVTLFLMTFISQWGNFLWQLIVNTPDSSFRTLPVGLALFRGQYGQDWEMLMAGACFSIIPIAILFLMAQRFFIDGMTTGAVKG